MSDVTVQEFRIVMRDELLRFNLRANRILEVDLKEDGSNFNVSWYDLVSLAIGFAGTASGLGSGQMAEDIAKRVAALRQ